MRVITSAAGAALILAAVLGCHSAGGGTATATSSAVRADETAAASIVSSCMPKNTATLTTKNGRRKFGECLEIPPAKRPAFTSCLTRAAEGDRLTKAPGRRKFAETDVPGCVEANR